MIDVAARVHLVLRSGGHTISSAESLTGGRLAVKLTETPGASETFLGGVVTYATELKHSLLGVPEELIEEHGVVSAECARAMATGIRGLTGSTYGVSTTGVAGPGEQEGKPAGTVFVGISGPGLLESLELELGGDRVTVQNLTVQEALSRLDGMLSTEETAIG